VAVENPEVHLHPSLQLKLTEYLVGEAKAGKVIVVETHSDLVVRRVLRAILAEEFPQAQLAIYFASLAGRDGSGGTPYPYSKLDHLQVNDRGQVSNWPKGFMDDDVREARRLLDAMYGPEPEATEGGDGDEE
jgi:predicted ATPase